MSPVKFGIIMFLGCTTAQPLLFNTPQFLTSFLSASASEPETNIANLRQSKSLKMDEFEEEKHYLKLDQNENEEEKRRNEANPMEMKKKIETVLEKLRLINDNEQMTNDNLEFEKNLPSSKSSGYFYPKAEKLQSPTDEASSNESTSGFNFANLGVFFTELVGSLIGMVIGAYAQASQGEAPSTSPPI